MAHFAEVDVFGTVLRVVVTDTNDPAGDEGYSWLVDNLGGTWLQTSYNATVRKNFAGVGYSYSEPLDAFIAPKPYESWLLDDEAQWQAPVPYPEGIARHMWDEQTTAWIEIT